MAIMQPLGISKKTLLWIEKKIRVEFNPNLPMENDFQ